ncbi:MAG: hypothetical protein ACJ0P6_05495 [Flavobacteriaceae bacterium]|jgi:hypothetical protein|tara:strand:+ start:2990 stop:3577 length:588 start_codon:yes stop_codon:yes gene_type:complete
MKKLLLTAALSIFAFGSAQISTNAGTFNKPSAGDIAFEMHFTPNLQGSSQFGEAQENLTGSTIAVMMRKWRDDSKAVRMYGDFNLNGSDADGADTIINAKFGYGIENHLAGAERLSTFWGYQGGIAIENIGGDDIDFGLAGGVFVGADYYIIPKVYIGTEFGFGLDVTAEGGDNGNTTFELDHNLSANFRIGFML